VPNLVEYALADGAERGVLSGTNITFTKRGDGSTRTMLAKFAKKDALGDRAYDFSEHGLACVLDVEKDEYRTIPLENVTKLEVGKTVYEVR
jgi:hypothetical protein